MKLKRQLQDTKKRNIYKKTELIQRFIKLFNFSFETNVLKFLLLEMIFKFKEFRTKIINFCVISGRSKGIHRKFKLSRVVLRELSGKGYFFGLRKAS